MSCRPDPTKPEGLEGTAQRRADRARQPRHGPLGLATAERLSLRARHHEVGQLLQAGIEVLGGIDDQLGRLRLFIRRRDAGEFGYLTSAGFLVQAFGIALLAHLHAGLDVDLGEAVTGSLASTLAIFPTYWLHRVTPVTKGTRDAVVGWVHGPSFR